MLSAHVASIPSPTFNSLEIGPLTLNIYGLLIACGVIAAVWLAGRKVAERGEDPEIISTLALWTLPAAFIGARLYYVLTNWDRFSDDLGSAFAIWEGGLGIPGGVLAGVGVGLWVIRRNDWPMPAIFDAVAVALPLGQIIGRFGNWFNQELYGRPTDLPWALEIEPENRVDGFEDSETFHPTFAYEILWNVGLFAFLMWLDSKRILRPGRLFAVYVIGYGLGRLWIEFVRIDPVSEFLGIRAHAWAMIVVIVGGVGYLIWDSRRHGGLLLSADEREQLLAVEAERRTARTGVDLDDDADEPAVGTSTRSDVGDDDADEAATDD